MVVVLPWLVPFLAKAIDLTRQFVASGGGTQYDYITLDLVLWAGLRRGMLAISGVAVAWALFRARRRPLGVLVLLWLGVTTFLANSSVSGLPHGFFTNGTVILALYLPASVLIGLAASDGLAQLEALAARRGRAAATLGRGKVIGLAFGAVLLVLSVWGVGDKISSGIEPWRYLVSNDDLAAMKWIVENTPPDAVFGVGGEFWRPRSVTGNDAGYWLPYIARRRTILPPMVYPGEAEPGYVARVASVYEGLNDAESSEDLSAALAWAGAEYVYVGNRVKQPWEGLLADDGRFQEVYARDGVRVYRRR